MKILMLFKGQIVPSSAIPYGYFPKLVLDKYNITPFSFVRVEFNKRKINFIAISLEQIDRTKLALENIPQDKDYFVASFRLSKLLNVSDDCVVNLSIWESFNLEIKPTLIDDFPTIDKIDVHPEVFKYFKKNGLTPYLLNHHFILPIKLRLRNNIKNNQVRISLSTRVILNHENNDKKIKTITLGGFNKKEKIHFLPRKHHYSYQLLRKDLLAALKRIVQIPVSLVEFIIRLFVRAPKLHLRTVEPFDGDDHQSIIRMHRECFKLLGIDSGEQVIINWNNRKTIATALEFEGLDERNDELKTYNKSMVETFYEGTAYKINNLSVGVSAMLRAALGIPRYTTISIRRRVVTLFLKKFNELLIPLIGLIIAGSSIEGFSSIYYYYGIFGSILFILISLRKWDTPKGKLP